MTEAFDLMSNSIFDNIVNTEDIQDINLDDIWKSDLSSYDIDSIPLLPTLEDFCQINNIDIAAVDTTDNQQQEPQHEILHDCMWSGTCLAKTHPAKKKNFRFYTNEGGDNCEDSDMDVETEIIQENNLPTVFQSLNRNMQNDPACTFQEIIQNTTITNRNYAQPLYQKASNQQLPQLQQTYQDIPFVYQNSTPTKIIEVKPEFPQWQQAYQNIPVIYQNSTPTKMSEVRDEQAAHNKLIKMENIKYEPIQHSEPFGMMPEQQQQQPVQQMFYCNGDQMPQILPFYPPIKYEPMNVVPQFFYQYPPQFDNNGNQICHLNDNGYFKNFQFTVLDQQNQKQTKKKTQDKRKGTKKSKLKEKKRCKSVDNMCFGQGSKRRPRSRQSTGSAEIPVEKRSMHNSMERQRRIGLKNLFVELKEAIPTLDERERVPKVSILREAIAYCQKLHSDEKLLTDLKRKHNRLMTQFHTLHKTMRNY